MAKKVLKIIYRIFVVLVTVLLIAVCILCGYMVVRKYAYKDDLVFLFGYTAANVITGSMEPTISQGDLVIIKECDSYEEGDIVTFYDESYGGYITHRLIEITDGLYITRGDANNANDSGVYIESIVGKVVSTIGGAGAVMEFFQTPLGILCIVGAVVALWFIADVVGILVKSKKKKEGSGNGENEKGDI